MYRRADVNINQATCWLPTEAFAASRARPHLCRSKYRAMGAQKKVAADEMRTKRLMPPIELYCPIILYNSFTAPSPCTAIVLSQHPVQLLFYPIIIDTGALLRNQKAASCSSNDGLRTGQSVLWTVQHGAAAGGSHFLETILRRTMPTLLAEAFRKPAHAKVTCNFQLQYDFTLTVN